VVQGKLGEQLIEPDRHRIVNLDGDIVRDWDADIVVRH